MNLKDFQQILIDLNEVIELERIPEEWSCRTKCTLTVKEDEFVVKICYGNYGERMFATEEEVISFLRNLYIEFATLISNKQTLLISVTNKIKKQSELLEKIEAKTIGKKE